MRVLIVDAANVVGSRPDGWWRDRAGAAERLVRRIRGVSWPVDEVVVVLEGAARPGVPVGSDAGVRVVHAAGSGDDEIVEQVRRWAAADGTNVAVVTADRALRERVAAAGASSVGPSWLRDRLPASHDDGREGGRNW